MGKNCLVSELEDLIRPLAGMLGLDFHLCMTKKYKNNIIQGEKIIGFVSFRKVMMPVCVRDWGETRLEHRDPLESSCNNLLEKLVSY